MSWNAVTFPQDIYPFDDPEPLVKEARAVYDQAGYPEGFAVYLQTLDDYSTVYYFSPVASSLCAELFKSYRVRRCDEPLPSSNSLVQIIP